MAPQELPTTTFRSYAHTIGIHHYTPWMWAEATYEAGPLLRALLRNNTPTEWREPVQVRHCRICKIQRIRRVSA